MGHFVRMIEVSHPCLHFLSLFVLYLCIDSTLRLVVHPLSNEELPLLAEVVRALSFTIVIHPVAFEMIPRTLSKHAVPVALAFMPPPLVDIAIRVDHSALAVGSATDPITVIPVSILEEEGASAVTHSFEPVSGVLSSELVLALVLPVRPLSVALTIAPHSFILISIFVNLNPETVLPVVAPVSDVAVRHLPLLALHLPVLARLPLLHPVHSAV